MAGHSVHRGEHRLARLHRNAPPRRYRPTHERAAKRGDPDKSRASQPGRTAVRDRLRKRVDETCEVIRQVLMLVFETDVLDLVSAAALASVNRNCQWGALVLLQTLAIPQRDVIRWFLEPDVTTVVVPNAMKLQYLRRIVDVDDSLLEHEGLLDALQHVTHMTFGPLASLRWFGAGMLPPNLVHLEFDGPVFTDFITGAAVFTDFITGAALPESPVFIRFGPVFSDFLRGAVFPESLVFIRFGSSLDVQV
jgi:hypothetical protein